MFFRREQPKEITFDQRMEELRKAGFTVTPAGANRDGGTRVTVRRDCYAAVLEDVPGAAPRVAERAGILMAGGIGKLVDGGFQKFFLAPDGQKKPALASELKAVHEFQEDLREALGLVSLYNESLGTVSTEYLYDRVQDRDRGVPKRPWE
jgi:hypothetical protein